MYDGNDIWILNQESEKWQYVKNDTVIAAQSGFNTALKRKDQDVLSDMFDPPGKEPLVRHQAQDSDKDIFRMNCFKCPPIGMGIIAQTATMCKWRIFRIDAKGAFVATQPDDYSIPPSESRYGNELW